MKICMIPTPDLCYESGSSLFATSLMTALAKKGHKIYVICQNRPQIQNLDVNIYELPLPLDYQVIVDRKVSNQELYQCTHLLSIKLCQLIDEEGIELVHSYYTTFTSLAGCYGKWLYGLPLIISSFGRDINVGAVQDFRLREMTYVTLREAAHVIVSNNSIASKLKEEFGVNADKITVIPMGVDTSLFHKDVDGTTVRRSMGIEDDQLMVLAIGSSFIPDKGIDIILRAIPQIIKRQHKARFVIVGHDDLPEQTHKRRLLSLIKQLKIEDYVIFAGEQLHAEIPQYIAGTDLFVDARLVGSFSAVILESLAMGKPIIASDVPGNTELITAGHNGYTFKCGSSEELANLICELLNNPNKIQTLAQQASRWFDEARQIYEFSAIAEKIERIYEQVLRI